jgi:hypothetical protein
LIWGKIGILTDHLGDVGSKWSIAFVDREPSPIKYKLSPTIKPKEPVANLL